MTGEIARLIGVYDANGTLRGELSYWIGARFGRVHCALCDITHGLVRERSAWRACRGELPAPFDTYHRDDQPDLVRAAAAGAAPVVVAETSDGSLHVLLDAAAIERCDGSPDALVAAVEGAAADAGLSWPSTDQR